MQLHHNITQTESCKNCDFFWWFSLIGFWLAGLVIGGILSEELFSFLIPFFEESIHGNVCVGAITVILFPLLASVAAVAVFSPFCVYILCFFFSFLLGVHLYCMSACFLSGSWLGILLAMFSKLTLSSVMLWFWHHCLAVGRHGLYENAFYCGLFCIGIWLIDLKLISPFLVDVVKF